MGNAKKRQQQQSVRFRAVSDHVQDRITVVYQHIQIRQQTRHAAPQGRFPKRCAPPHDSDANRGT
jgi:hypothetical protein